MLITAERQNAAGTWTLAEAFDLARCVGGTYEGRQTGRVQIASVEQAAELLARGGQIKYGSDWYDNVRIPRALRTPVAASVPPFTCPQCGGHRDTTLAGHCDDCEA